MFLQQPVREGGCPLKRLAVRQVDVWEISCLAAPGLVLSFQRDLYDPWARVPTSFSSGHFQEEPCTQQLFKSPLKNVLLFVSNHLSVGHLILQTCCSNAGLRNSLSFSRNFAYLVSDAFFVAQFRSQRTTLFIQFQVLGREAPYCVPRHCLQIAWRVKMRGRESSQEVRAETPVWQLKGLYSFELFCPHRSGGLNSMTPQLSTEWKLSPSAFLPNTNPLLQAGWSPRHPTPKPPAHTYSNYYIPGPDSGI